MLGLDVRKRSRVFALSPARSGTRVGSEITCVKSLTMAKASASRPAGFSDIGGIGETFGVVDVEITKNDDFRAWRL